MGPLNANNVFSAVENMNRQISETMDAAVEIEQRLEEVSTPSVDLTDVHTPEEAVEWARAHVEGEIRRVHDMYEISVRSADGNQAADEPSLPDPAEVAEKALGYVLSDDTRGSSISVDDGKTPRSFGYGQNKNTIGELKWVDDTDYPGVHGQKRDDEFGAKVRAFGSSSAQTLSASIGLETEIGAKTTTEQGSRARQQKMVEERFIGVRGRVYGEVGLLGASAGGEAFAGFSNVRTSTKGPVGTGKDWTKETEQVEVGVRTSAQVHVGAFGASAMARAQAGIDYRYQRQDNIDTGGTCGWMLTEKINVFVGAMAEAKASIGLTGFSASAGAFAGAKATFQEQLGVAYQGAEIAAGFVQVEGRVGVGADAHCSAGYDIQSRKFTADAGAGVAVGIGAAVGGGVSVGGNDFEKMFESK